MNDLGFMTEDEIRGAVARANSGERVVLWFTEDKYDARLIGIELKRTATFEIKKSYHHLTGYIAIPSSKDIPLVGTMRYNPLYDGIFENFWHGWAWLQRKKQRPK